MGALITREQARERFLQRCGESFDRRIPVAVEQPVRGETFREWENQTDELTREVGGVFLETMAELHGQASASSPGVCPHCGAEKARFLRLPPGPQERQSGHGPVVLPRQVARCRSCGRTFSPSGAGLGAGCGFAADAPGGRAGGAGGGGGGL